MAGWVAITPRSETHVQKIAEITRQPVGWIGKRGPLIFIAAALVAIIGFSIQYGKVIKEVAVDVSIEVTYWVVWIWWGPCVPTGTVVMWSGEVKDIPWGWALCDGENGTPNLRDRFLVGAGGDYSPKDKGDGGSHSHTTTLAAVSSGASTSHPGLQVGIGPEEEVVTGATTLTTVALGQHSHNVRRLEWTRRDFAAGDHNHGVSLGDTVSSVEVPRPPWYALAFIMKL